MKERRRGGAVGRALLAKGSLPSSFALFALMCGVIFASIAFSTFRILGVAFKPVLLPPWRKSGLNAIGSDHPFLRRVSATTKSSSVRIPQAISFPDQVLLFPQSSTILQKSDLVCRYYQPNKTSPLTPDLELPAILPSLPPPFIRCPLGPRGFSISLSSYGPPLEPLPYDHLAYAALIELQDNSTIVFAKGFNLRSGRLSDPSRFECVYGWNLENHEYHITSTAVTAAQEIFRCITPPSILRFLGHSDSTLPPLVSVQSKGRGAVTLPSVARAEVLLPQKKQHSMCVCTMLRNQAKFLREWIMYHHHIGIEQWFIYDNDSDDDIEQVIELLVRSFNYKIIRHLWPWVKTQEAGFAHCALRAKGDCEWVAFIDVDEFLYIPSNATLHDVLQNYSSIPWIGELRASCHSFGPSGRKSIPVEGVMLGYTCRMLAPERHKSIVRPEALNPSLMTAVHHFHLKDGMSYANLERAVIGINHYKYQVWQVFKDKFHRRVATYVSDWQNEENVGSKDRAPGLGTKAVEPSDWSSRFCEVNDTWLSDWVTMTFVDPQTGLPPWQEGQFNLIDHIDRKIEKVDNLKRAGKSLTNS